MINEILPPYLSSTLNTYQPFCSLRSSGEKLQKVDKYKIRRLSLFQISGPRCLELASFWSATISFPSILQIKPQNLDLPVSKILPHQHFPLIYLC